MALKAGRVGVNPNEVDSSGMIRGNKNAYTKDQTDVLLNAKANKSTTYTKEAVNGLFLSILPDLFDTPPTVEASGNPIVLSDAVQGDVSACELTLLPIQTGSGTPSSENVRPIIGRTQNEINRYGKNLTPLPTLQGLWLTADGTFESRSTWVATAKFSVLPGKTYTASATRETRAFVVVYWDANGNYISYDANTTFGEVLLTFTTPSNCTTIALEVADIYNGAGIVPSDVTDLMLYPGSTATTYEPYIEPTSITLTYGTTIYGGAVNAKEGTAASEWVNIAEYDGETITEPWLSSMDEYTPGGTPTTGAQVVYKAAEATTVSFTGDDLSLLAGNNIITSDADNVEITYGCDVAKYIERKLSSPDNRSLNRSFNLNREVIGEDVKKEIQEEIKEEIKEVPEEKPVTVKKSTKKSTK